MIYMVCGRMRQGKSTLGLFIAKKSPTRVIFDPRKQFGTTAIVLTSNVGLFELLDTESEIIIRPGLQGEEILDAVAQEILDWTEQNPEETICFLIDEANMVGLDSRPQEHFPHLNYLLRCAGEEKINIVVTSHRPTEIHPAIRSIASSVAMFRTTHEPDLHAFEEKCGPEVTELLKTLNSREVVIWDDNVGTWKRHSDHTKWFVELNPILVQPGQREAE